MRRPAVHDGRHANDRPLVLPRPFPAPKPSTRRGREIHKDGRGAGEIAATFSASDLTDATATTAATPTTSAGADGKRTTLGSLG